MIEENKFSALTDLLELLLIGQIVIFCNTIKKAQWLYEKMLNKNYICSLIFSKIPQKERIKISNEFKSGKFRILIATDVYSRGIDIPDVYQ